MATYWIGSKPSRCDLCGAELKTTFIDGATIYGPWGMLCTGCHAGKGLGLGLGRGQRYERQTDGRWKKVEG